MCSRPFFHIIKLVPSSTESGTEKGKSQELANATVIGFSFANEEDANKLGLKIKYFVEGDSLNVTNNVASKLRIRSNPEKSPKRKPTPIITASPNISQRFEKQIKSSSLPSSPLPRHSTISITNPSYATDSMDEKTRPRRRTITFLKNFKKATSKKSKIDEETVIGNPRNFVHASHIGWDPTHGFQVRNLPAKWKALFSLAGVTNDELEDKDTANFIMDTVRSKLPPQESLETISAEQEAVLTEMISKAMSQRRAGSAIKPATDSEEEWSDG
eukprot:TRINITY_DN5240_c0_g2_i1.p1 TRINITY_DN5240_c0_g2~~TRINITY_DN5240_c0_g2_i1.p1  ORF type:complete len:306 (+),score=59.37 TRINITY_DN5240_c0_g2_i1:104-919(+)